MRFEGLAEVLLGRLRRQVTNINIHRNLLLPDRINRDFQLNGRRIRGRRAADYINAILARIQGRAQKSSRAIRLALRNRFLMVVKNDSLAHFLRDLPLILAAEVPRLAYTALTTPRALLGLVDLVRELPAALAKRRKMHLRWRVDQTAIRHWFVAAHQTAVEEDTT